MSIAVDFGEELGLIEFDDMTEEQVREEVRSNRQKYRQALIQARFRQQEQETQSKLESGEIPTTFAEKTGTVTANILRGAARGVAAIPSMIAEGAAEIDKSKPKEELITYKIGKSIREKVDEFAVPAPGMEDRFWMSDVPSGVGSVGAMLTTGLAGKAVNISARAAALTTGFAAEMQEAHEEELQRQKVSGEPVDNAHALKKAMLYATIATAIESRLGAGRLIKKYEKAFGKTPEAIEKALEEAGVPKSQITKFIQSVSGDAFAGGVEEGLQQLAKDTIVHGEVDWNRALRSAAAGAVVQGMFGVPPAMSGKPPPKPGAPQTEGLVEPAPFDQSQLDTLETEVVQEQGQKATILPPELGGTSPTEPSVSGAERPAGDVSSGIRDIAPPEGMAVVDELLEQVKQSAPLTAVVLEKTMRELPEAVLVPEPLEGQPQEPDTAAISVDRTALASGTELTLEAAAPADVNQTGAQPSTVETAIAEANWRGSVREVPAPRSMGGAGVKLYIPVDASGKDVTVGGRTILGKTPTEAIELAQKNVKPTPAAPVEPSTAKPAEAKDLAPKSEPESRAGKEMETKGAKAAEAKLTSEATTQPNGVVRVIYRDRSGAEVGYGHLDGKVINMVSVEPRYQKQGVGAAIIKDLRQRGGVYGVAGTKEGLALMRSKSVGATEYEPNKFTFDKAVPAEVLFTDKAIAAIQKIEEGLEGKTFSDPLLLTPMFKAVLIAVRRLLMAGRQIEVAIREAIAEARAQFPDNLDTDESITQVIMDSFKDARLTPPVSTERTDTSEARYVMNDVLPETDKDRLRWAEEQLVAFGGNIESMWNALENANNSSQPIPFSYRHIATGYLINQAVRRIEFTPNPIEREALNQLLARMGPAEGSITTQVAQALQSGVQYNKLVGPFAPYMELLGIIRRRTEKLAKKMGITVGGIETRVKDAGKQATDELADAMDDALKEADAAAERIIRAFAKIQSDTPSLQTHKRIDLIREAFMRQVEDAKSLSSFTATMEELGVDPVLSSTMFPIAARETKTRAFVKGEKGRELRRQILAGENNALGKLLKQWRDKLSIEDWRTLFTSDKETQLDRQKELYKRIRQHPVLKNLSKEEANQLAAQLQAVWQKRRQKVFMSELEKATIEPEKKAKLKKVFPKLFYQINLGLLNSDAFRAMLAKEFGIAHITPEAQRKVYAAVQEAQKAPEGFQREDSIHKAFEVLHRESGISMGEIMSSWWYSSVLSGTQTQARNIAGNAFMLTEATAASIATDPRHTAQYLTAALRGLRDNILRGEFRSIMSGSQSSRPGLTAKVEAPLKKVAELWKDDEKLWKRLFSKSRYVMRFMVAVDSMFYDMNHELASQRLAFTDGKESGLSWHQLDAYAKDLLNLDPNKKLPQFNRRTAAEQAEHEGLVPGTREFLRRVVEIREQARPDFINDDAGQTSLENTLNQNMQGVLGWFGNAILIGRKNFPPIMAIFPFVRIASNATNTLLQRSPFGLYYIVRNGQTDGNAIGRLIGINPDITPDQYQQLRAKVFISNVVFTALATAVAAALDDKDPWIEMTSGMENLPSDKRRQLEAQGIKPYSLIINGRRFDYRMMPGAVMMAMIGEWSIQHRYNREKWNEKEFLDKLSSVVLSGKAVVLDQSFLSGLSTVLDRGQQGGKDSAEYIPKFFLRFAGGMIPSIAKEIDAWFAPEVRRTEGLVDYGLSQLPVVRHSVGVPIYNALGEPVKREKYPWSWFTEAPKQGPIWKAIGDKHAQGVFIPQPSPTATVIDEEGDRVRMNRYEYARYARDVGKAYKEWFQSGNNLGKFRDASTEEAKEILKKEFSAIREKIRKDMKR